MRASNYFSANNPQVNNNDNNLFKNNYHSISSQHQTKQANYSRKIKLK